MPPRRLRAAFFSPFPGLFSHLQHANPTRKFFPEKKSQKIFKKINKNHAQRAVLSPPRLPALCVGFNAGAFTTQKPASAGGLR